VNAIKRPLVVILIGIIIGIVYGLYFKTSIALAIIIISIIFLILCLITRKRRLIYFLMKRRKLILIIFISAIISNIYFNLKNNQYEKFYKIIPENLKTTATIVSESKETEYYNSYNVEISNKKFIMYVKKGYMDNLKYGMKIYLEGEYSEATDSRNFKGFSYKEYLKTKKIYGTIKINEIEILKENNVNFILKYSNSLRNKIIETINKIVQKNTRGLLAGILIGETGEISNTMEEEFRNSSLSHIIAISGSHITYIIMGISYVLVSSKISKRITYIITILALILFMFLTNFSPSVVRACIMGIIMLFSKIFYRKLDVLTSIALSLVILLIDNPFSINDIGLKLSYLGTIGIIALNKPILDFIKRYIKKQIAEILSVTISAQIIILPIMMLQFNNISTIFLISNLLAVPLSGIIILLGYANVIIGMFSITIGKVIGIFTNGVLQILIWIAEYTAKIPLANIIVKTPNILTVVMYYVMVYCVYKKKYIKYAIVVMIIVTVFTNIISINLGILKIHFIDVGQR